MTAGSIYSEARAWADEHWDPTRPLGEWWQLLADSGWGYPEWPVHRFGRGLDHADDHANAKRIQGRLHRAVLNVFLDAVNATRNLLAHQTYVFTHSLANGGGFAERTAFATGENGVSFTVQTLRQIVIVQNDVVWRR